MWNFKINKQTGFLLDIQAYKINTMDISFQLNKQTERITAWRAIICNGKYRR